MLNLLLSNSALGTSKKSCCYLSAPCAHKGQTALAGLHKCRPETPGTVPPVQEEVGPRVAAVSGPSAQHTRWLTQGLICMQGLDKCWLQTTETVPPAGWGVGGGGTKKGREVGGPGARGSCYLWTISIAHWMSDPWPYLHAVHSRVRQHSRVCTNADFKQLKQSLQQEDWRGVGGGGGETRVAAVSGPSAQHTGCPIHALSACSAHKCRTALMGLHEHWLEMTETVPGGGGGGEGGQGSCCLWMLTAH